MKLIALLLIKLIQDFKKNAIAAFKRLWMELAHCSKDLNLLKRRYMYGALYI